MAKQTPAEMRQKAEELMRAAEEAEAEQRQAVFEQINALLSEAGLSPQDYIEAIGPKAKKKPKAQIPPKYKGPDGELWSGRGRMPSWVRKLGRSDAARKKALEGYLIQ